MPHLLPIIFLLALGACVGSFLKVVVNRLPKATTLWNSFSILTFPPSHCPNCKNELKWYDNIPVLGWLKLRGKCRFCRTGAINLCEGCALGDLVALGVRLSDAGLGDYWDAVDAVVRNQLAAE